jgi:hypothetical protein
MPTSSRPQLVSSRLAKREQKKMVKQTLFLGIGVVAFSLAFVLFIAPAAVQWLGALILGDATIGDIEDTLPPQIPIVAAPITATYSAQLKMSGFGESDSEVVVVLNGSEASRQKITAEGTFELDINLAENENQLQLYSIDAAGNESATTKTYSIVMDNQPPTLEISQPQNGSTIELRKNQLTTIQGKTEPRARVFVNGRQTTANDQGDFSTTYQLQEGENKLMLEAQDLAGNKTQQELIINFKF